VARAGHPGTIEHNWPRTDTWPVAQSNQDAIQLDQILRQAEIAAILREHMPADAWVELPLIYDIVEAHSELTAEDLGLGRQIRAVDLAGRR
jgi:hypothetical protein